MAICSKNDKTTALQPFKEHSGMILKEGDFAVFVANYNDKASNIREIASRLNVGLDQLYLQTIVKLSVNLQKKIYRKFGRWSCMEIHIGFSPTH